MRHTTLVAEYIWLGGDNELRSKTKVIYTESDGNYPVKGPTILASNLDPTEFPEWNFDGSSTNQASGLNSELKLKPVAVYKNPFTPYPFSVLVLCETFDKNNIPLPTNTRNAAAKIFKTEQAALEKPWYGIEQEYFIIGDKFKKHVHEAGPQGQYYCSVGSQNAIYRNVAEHHLRLCIHAGLRVSGINAEVAPCQWEYQIGPCLGIEASDQLWISRWIMERVSETHNVTILWDAKPFTFINGSGCHTNFSTESMRKLGTGLDIIYKAIEKLQDKHAEHMQVYGKGNELRMSGKYETAQFDVFSFDREKPVDRGASIRVGYETLEKKGGYFEDRRPASSMDPYKVTSQIFKTTCL